MATCVIVLIEEKCHRMTSLLLAQETLVKVCRVSAIIFLEPLVWS